MLHDMRRCCWTARMMGVSYKAIWAVTGDATARPISYAVTEY